MTAKTLSQAATEAAIAAGIITPTKRVRKPKATPAPAVELPKITPGMHTLFMAYANDAGNWSNTPLVGGNVGGSKQDAGTLMHLKMRKLVTTSYDKEPGRPETQWLHFTPLGKAYAAAHGVTL